jgi:hypothetical protein
MVASIGWNPQFKNEKMTIEPHIIHKFDHDFYGEHIKVSGRDRSEVKAKMPACHACYSISPQLVPPNQTLIFLFSLL